MPRASLIVGGLALLLAGAASPAFAIEPDADGNYNIMRPEPGTPAARRPAAHRRAPQAAPKSETETVQPKGYGFKQDTRRGSSNPVYPAPLPRPQAPAPVPRIEAPSQRATVPPSMVVPQTGRVLPNLGAGRPETSQDKAVRCAHQAGVYGPNLTGNPSAYIGSCINQ